MSKSVKIPGFENKDIVLASGWTYKLKVDGKEAGKGSGKQEFVIPDDSGQEKTLVLKPQVLDLPAVEFNGELYYFAKPVGVAPKIFLAFLLIPLLLGGGGIGGALAGVGFVTALSAFQNDKAPWIQYGLGFLYAGAAWIAYLFIGGGFMLMLGR